MNKKIKKKKTYKVCPVCGKSYLAVKDLKHMQTKGIIGKDFVHGFEMIGSMPSIISCWGIYE